jgi:hypothetical protein
MKKTDLVKDCSSRASRDWPNRHLRLSPYSTMGGKWKVEKDDEGGLQQTREKRRETLAAAAATTNAQPHRRTNTHTHTLSLRWLSPPCVDDDHYWPAFPGHETLKLFD